MGKGAHSPKKFRGTDILRHFADSPSANHATSNIQDATTISFFPVMNDPPKEASGSSTPTITVYTAPQSSNVRDIVTVCIVAGILVPCFTVISPILVFLPLYYGIQGMHSALAVYCELSKLFLTIWFVLVEVSHMIKGDLCSFLCSRICPKTSGTL